MTLTSRDYYFDYKDIEEPIKYTFDDFNTFLMNNYNSLLLTVEVEANTYEIQDNIINSYEKSSGAFYSLGRTISSYSQKEKEAEGLMRLIFQLGKRKNEYQRQVYNIFDLLSEVGGIFQFIQFIPMAIVGFISSKLFYYSIISEKIDDSTSKDTTKDPFKSIDALKELIGAHPELNHNLE